MKMKHIVTTGLFAGSLLMGTSAFAEGETPAVAKTTEVKTVTGTQEKAGITPDSFFYNFDKLAEKLQLLFTNKPEKEADLFLQFANERLAETDKMAELEKKKYINQLIEQYLLTLQKAQEKVGEVVSNEETDSQVKEDLSTKLEDTTSVTEGVEQNLDGDRQTVLDEKRQEAYLVANVIKDIDPEKVKSLREQGFGFGEIVKVVSLAEASGKTEDEMAALLKEGKGYGAVVKELDMEPSQITKNILDKKKKHLETLMEKKLKAGNQEAAEHIAKSIEAIERKKVEFHIANNDEGKQTGLDKKIAIIKEKAAAGLIPQDVADRKINILQNKAVKKGTDSTENTSENDDQATKKNENENEKEMQKQVEKEKKEQEKAEREKQKELEKEKQDQEKAEREKQKELEKEKQEQEKAEREKQKELEKEKQDQEKAEREKQKELEKEKKEQEKAEREKQKELEKEKKEQEKAEKNDDDDED